MYAYDYDALCLRDGTVICMDCFTRYGGLQEEDGHPIFAGSEWDCYPTCDYCGDRQDYVMLTYELCPDCKDRDFCLDY